MRFRITAATLTLIALTCTSAMARDDHDDLLRNLISTGATTASTYLTSGGDDDKLVGPVQDDASSFIASEGEIRGPYLEAELQRLRSESPELQARSDLELAGAILAAEPR
ncbi:DUF2388 domain-containing protein [Pseudomonas sp. BN415]|uniref:DUF2388 domain-containing protein n=1 Tax=Pseudomonas sp. BN415 TaxID=2567889 RepID=UPI002459117E|nr:DUF2388 domain-containing protein [Pseudomonas sp. BN415]MDH4585602.1 DUF2388 domain-containing protein [Pseudomonas sp. BN415]